MAELFSIKSVYQQANLLGVECPPQDFEDFVLNGWMLINNKHTRLYKFIGDTDEEGVLQLPCNVQIVEAVKIPMVDAEYTSSDTNYYNAYNIISEAYVEGRIHSDKPFYNKGKYVSYKEGDGELYFNHPYKHVMVIYQGVLVDDEGLPLINDKEMLALAYYVAYMSLLQEGLRKRDKASIELAATMQGEWLRKCNAARIPDHLSQNDMDDILEVKSR